MYKRPKFIEILHEIRQEMAAEADYDLVFFAEMIRTGDVSVNAPEHRLTDEPPPVASRRERELERADK